VSIEEVRALVAERQRYDEWLAALDSKRADTPPRVFDRVYGDYVGRRAEVITQLQAHVGELTAFGTELEQRLSDLETQLSANEEELAEGMLRNLVGEYDDDRWATVREAVERKITALGGERDALLLEVEDVRALLSSAHVVPPAPTPASSVVIEEAAVVVSAVAGSAVDVDDVSAMFVEDAPESVPPALETASVDDVASVVLTPMAATEVALVDEEPLLDIDVLGIVEHPAPAPTTDKVPVSQSEVDDALAMFGEVSGPANQQFVQSLQGIEADHELLVDETTVTPPVGLPATSPATPVDAASANDPFDDLAFLRSVIDQGGEDTTTSAATERSGAGTSAGASGEPQKTLRCTECSTMNLPTEWYCERCGGELAAF
jgi:hypothetical protein